MNNYLDYSRQFRVLQLLVKADYQSEFFTFVSESDDEIHFKTKPCGASYIVVNKDNIIRIITDITTVYTLEEFRRTLGNIDAIKYIKKLLSSPTYIGCKIQKTFSSCYFIKYGKTYELYLYHGDYVALQVLRTDESGTTECKFEDFVNLILHTTNVKSARN